MNPAYRILHLQRVTSATESPNYTKKGAGQHTIPVVRRLKCSVKSGAPSSHKKQRARYTSLFIHDMYFLFPYVGIIQIRFQVKTNQVYSQPIYLSSPFVRHYTKLRNNFQAFFNISPFSAVSVTKKDPAYVWNIHQIFINRIHNHPAICNTSSKSTQLSP